MLPGCLQRAGAGEWLAGCMHAASSAALLTALLAALRLCWYILLLPYMQHFS
jgi:hypothetical protein